MIGGIHSVGTSDGYWTPKNGPQPLLWLSADTGVSVSSGKVVSWTDQSGHGYVFAARSSPNRPAFSATGWNGNRPAIVFGPAYTELVNTSAGLADLSASFSVRIFMTIDVTSLSTLQKVIAWVDQAGTFGTYEIQITTGHQDQVSYSSGGALITGNTFVGKTNTNHTMNHTGDGYTQSFLNGQTSIVHNLSTPTSATDTVAFGGNILLGNGALSANLAEVIIYNIASADNNVMDNYLNYAKLKWGGF